MSGAAAPERPLGCRDAGVVREQGRQLPSQAHRRQRESCRYRGSNSGNSPLYARVGANYSAIPCSQQARVEHGSEEEQLGSTDMPSKGGWQPLGFTWPATEKLQVRGE